MQRHRTLSRRSFGIIAVVPSIALFALGIGACGVDDTDVPLPVFEGGPGVATSSEAGDGSVDGANETSGDAEVNETSADSAAGDGSTAATSLVISQMQSRGTAGGNDELIEIYNGTAASITFDASWTLTVRNATGGLGACVATPSVLYTGANQVIASHKHLLLTASAYSESVPGDATFGAGIPDAASLVLLHAAATVDALCFSYDATTTGTLTGCTIAYTCEGTPATNPHDNTASATSNADNSLERKPGGAGGNGTDANDNATDFSTATPADPHNLAAAAVP